MRSVTTSIRLTPKLADRLQRVALRLARGKSWIIAQALQEYLARVGHDDLVAEAKRQSVLASQGKRHRSEPWDSDTAGWR